MDLALELHEKIHKFEDKKKLLEYKLEYKNVPMWPLVRLDIILTCIDNTIGILNERKREHMAVRKNKWKELTIKNPFFSLPKDVIYIGYPNDDMMEFENGCIYDERVKSYVDVHKNSSMLVSIIAEDKFQYAYKNWKSDYIMNQLAQRRKKDVNRKDVQVAKEFINYLKVELPFHMDQELSKMIFNIIIAYSNHLCAYTEVWKLYLKRMNPSLVVLCDGCYMGIVRVAMNLACYDLHISTAEIQHGWEGKTSHAHYWGDEIVQSSDCKRIFPDYFLTMGKYWNSQVNVPSQKIVIGTHRKYLIDPNKRNDNLLICLSTCYESYIDLIDLIIQSTGMNTKIYLRLHPVENTNEVRALFSKFIQSKRFEFANDKKLESYFCDCSYVISCGSTVIYEALTCGKIVFVPKDKMYELYNLDTIKDKIYSFQKPQQFMELWNDRNNLQARAYDDFYNMNYRKLYKKFIMNTIKRKQRGFEVYE